MQNRSPFFGILLAALSVLSGCSTINYKELSDLGASHAIESPKNAVTTIPSINVPLSEEAQFDIDESDPIVNMGSYFSYFKLIKFSIPKPGSYKFELKSVCDCFGFTKTLLIPKVLVLDLEGNTLEEQPKHFDKIDAEKWISYHLKGTWETRFDRSGDFFLLVTGDKNLKEPSNIATLLFDVITVLPSGAVYKNTGAVSVQSSLVGDIRLKVDRL